MPRIFNSYWAYPAGPASATAYTVNELNQYTQVGAQAFGYDANGNLTTRTTRRGEPIAFAYDNLNRLATKTPPAPMPIVTYAYDLAGRVTQRRGKVRESLCRFLLAGTCSENEAVDPLLPGTC